MRRRFLNIRKGLLRSVLPLLHRLPPRAAARGVAKIGRMEHVLLPGLRQATEAAVARAADHFGASWEVAAVARALSGNLVRWRTYDLVLDGRSRRQVATAFSVAGRYAIDAELGRGRGVILLGSHFGAHMMTPHWLLRAGYPLRLFMERPRHVSRSLAEMFDTDGPFGQRGLFISRKSEPAEAAGSILRAARVLKAGMIVYLAGDVRWTGPHTAPAVFLGRLHTFSTTWVLLAAMAQAPVVPVFCRMEDDGGHHLEFLPGFQVPGDAPRSGQAPYYVQDFLQTLEEWVGRSPANSNDYFFWPGTPAPALAELERFAPAILTASGE